MKYIFGVAALVSFSGCDIVRNVLTAVDSEIGDGVFIVRTDIDLGDDKIPGIAYHRVLIAQDRTGSSARFGGLESGTFFRLAHPILETNLVVSPDGNWIALAALTDEFGVYEFNYGVVHIERNLEMVASGTDDAFFAAIDRDCGFETLFADTIDSELRSAVGYDPEQATDITFDLYDPSGVEWRTVALGFTGNSKPVFSLDVRVAWTAEQEIENEPDWGYESTITDQVFVALSTQGGIGLQILECWAEPPTLAPTVVTIHATGSLEGATQQITVDGAPLRTFLLPDEEFQIRTGTNQRPVTNVFERQ